MKDFYVIFKMQTNTVMIDRQETLFRIPMRARSFGEAERKFNKQTSNKFGAIKHRIITEIRMK